nr:amidohydrolase family protein [Bacillus subtilis]
MIDIHIHGGYGADTMDASFSALDIMSSRLPEEGTTSFLATTITQEHGNISQSLVNAREWKAAEESSLLGAELLGIHLEAPLFRLKEPERSQRSGLGLRMLRFSKSGSRRRAD